MCGICGFVDFKSRSNIDMLNNMVSTLNHRGPDDKGSEIYNVNSAAIGFGHTRLSIIDLSDSGHQPMQYEHFEIVFNGEIYNFKEIREELKKLSHTFRSESDTEVILHAFAEWGDKCVSKFIGMFAIVILNKQSQELTLIRDRAGVKPLYYYWKDDLFLFSSELKAFHQHPKFIKKINKDAVYKFMDFGYIPSPYCIFEFCNKLDPGNTLKFSLIDKSLSINKYWDVKDYYKLPKLKIDYNEAKIEVEKLLISAFEYRMVSDVPVGIFLSGGYDSTAVVGLLQKNREEKLKTFSIGVEDGNDEAPFAKGIAEYLKTDHTEYYCTTKESQEIITDLPFYYDEPFADSSAIPTTLVSKLAKNDVAVALSGDAGDEIFAGYNIYDYYQRDLNRLFSLPKLSKGIIRKSSDIVEFLLPKSKGHLKHKFNTLSKVLNSEEGRIQQELYKSYYSLNKTVKSKLFNSSAENQPTAFDFDYTRFKDDLSIPLSIDYEMYLQNDILTKVDRATMSVSLEGREPFLDHRIIEFAAQLPMEYKYGEQKKIILRDIVHGYIPKKLMDRPKSGFSIPIYSWLKKDLRELLEDVFNTFKDDEDIFNIQYIKDLKNDFLNDKLSNPLIIWKLLQFQLWYKKWM